jgi:hypothetical protein
LGNLLVQNLESSHGCGDEYEREYHRIGQWWLAHRGESWRPVPDETPRLPVQGVRRDGTAPLTQVTPYGQAVEVACDVVEALPEITLGG